jgi:hypothetical protein
MLIRIHLIDLQTSGIDQERAFTFPALSGVWIIRPLQGRSHAGS